MKIYISSSRKNRERVRALAIRLREKGHEVYDFTDPESRKAFGGVEIPPERFPEQFDPEKHNYREYLLAVPEWEEAVLCNQRALHWCDLAVLLLPCGMDAHADWGLAVGLGKHTVVAGAPRAGERTPSHLWADALLDRDEDVLTWEPCDGLR